MRRPAEAHPEDLLDLVVDPGRSAAGVQPQRSPAVGPGLEVRLAALLDGTSVEEVAGVGKHVLPLGLQLQAWPSSAAGSAVGWAGVNPAFDSCSEAAAVQPGVCIGERRHLTRQGHEGCCEDSGEFAQTPGW